MAYIDDVYLVVNIAPVGIPTYVRLSQNENGRRLYFAVAGGEIPSGSTATMSGTKPDGVVYSKAGTVSGNTVTFSEDIQMTAVAGEWPAKIVIVNGGQTVMTARIRFVIDADTVAAGAVPSDSQLEGLVAQAAAYAEAAKDGAFYGSPLVASAVAEMTDQTRVYVYTGSESGYTAGNWYYWDGSAWTSGGVYNATAVSTDTTLSVAGKAADAKATGDAIRAVTIPTDKTLTQSDKPADAKVVGDEIADLKDDYNSMARATSADIGKALKAKRVAGGEVVEWEFGEAGGADPEVIEQAVTDWLDAHPEATTTVEDGSIDEVKLTDALEQKIDVAALPNTLPIEVLYNKVNYDDYNIVQSGCVLDNYLYVAFTQRDNDTDIKLRKISLSNFSVQSESTIALFHGQTMTGINEKLYISNRAEIVVVNANTFAIENRYTAEQAPFGICVNGRGNIITVGWPDLRVREYSITDFSLVTDWGVLKTELQYDPNQADIEYNNGYYYLLLSGPTCLYVYDESFALVKIIDVRERYERITLKETEFITYKGDGNFIIGWNTPLLPDARNASYPTILETIFTETNLTRANSNNEEQTIIDYYNPNAMAYVYVNKAYTGNYSNGDWRYPFKEIQQAFNDVNIPSACYVICIKAGEYCPVFAVDKNFMFEVWPNQSTPQSLRDVTVNSICLIGCHGSISNIKVTPSEGTGGYGLRLELGSTCWANIVTANEYSAYVTNDARLVTHGLNIPVTMASGLYLPNSRSTRTSATIVKNTGSCKILGRVKMYSGSEKTGIITLSNGMIKDYVILLATITVDNKQFTGVMAPTGATIIPILYYDGTSRVEGTFTITRASDTTVTVALACKKDSAAYTPAQFSWIIDGIL